jgi:hypothetical protein
MLPYFLGELIQLVQYQGVDVLSQFLFCKVRFHTYIYSPIRILEKSRRYSLYFFGIKNPEITPANLYRWILAVPQAEATSMDRCVENHGEEAPRRLDINT